MPQTLFTSRNGGVSAAPFDSMNLALHVGDDPKAVSVNRALLAKQIGISSDQLYFMNQVHGRNVAVIDEYSNSLNEPTADALFTRSKGKALAVLVADCTPLLLKSERAIAAVHVGRRGLVANVLEATLRLFAESGVSRNEISAELGPSICGDCYEVDLKTYTEVVAKTPRAATTIESHCLDISSGLKSQLESAEIAFTSSEICVKQTSGFFSYRREGQTGRQAGVIWL